MYMLNWITKTPFHKYIDVFLYVILCVRFWVDVIGIDVVGLDNLYTSLYMHILYVPNEGLNYTDIRYIILVSGVGASDHHHIYIFLFPRSDSKYVEWVKKSVRERERARDIYDGFAGWQVIQKSYDIRPLRTRNTHTAYGIPQAAI